MNSLDFENGEPIASNLYNLYDYCKKAVLKDYRNLETKGIESSKEVFMKFLTLGYKLYNFLLNLKKNYYKFL